MGISKSLCSWIVEGVCSSSGNIMTMYKTNFNMPVPALFGGCSNRNEGFMDARYCSIGGTSHSLVGFYPGYEFALADGLYRWLVSEGNCLNGIACINLGWCKTGCCFGGFGLQVCVNLNSSSGTCCWSYYESMANTGIAGWEVCCDGTHCTVAGATTVSGDDVSISACTICLDIGGVPSTSQCAGSLMGSAWVEGNTLNYINANCWEHVITGDCQSGAAAANRGAIWVDTNHYLNWVGNDCNVYRAPWRICQFSSTFSNGAPVNPSPGAGYAGAIWVDNQFGNTHLSYIGCDGNKYLAGAGECPYVAP